MAADPERDQFALVDELDRAGVEFAPAVARGFLAALADLAEQHAPAGDLGRFGDAAIERACGWTRAPGALVQLLIRAGVLAENSDHRLVLVGWWERASDSAHGSVARSRTYFACGRTPKLGQLPSRERQELGAWYAENETSLDRALTAVPARSAQIPLFSSLREVLPEEEKRSGSESERAREVRPPARRGLTAVPPPEPIGLDEAILRANTASAAYGRPFGEIRGARRDLASATMREQPERGLDVLAQCVHGYWSARGKANAKWDPLEHLQPQTVWKAEKRGGYLDAYDDAIARGLSPPFVPTSPHRAPPRDATWLRESEALIAERCAALRVVALDAWGDEARADREQRIFAERGAAAIARGDRRELRDVLSDLAADAESIARERAAPLAAGGAGP